MPDIPNDCGRTGGIRVYRRNKLSARPNWLDTWVHGCGAKQQTVTPASSFTLTLMSLQLKFCGSLTSNECLTSGGLVHSFAYHSISLSESGSTPNERKSFHNEKSVLLVKFFEVRSTFSLCVALSQRDATSISKSKSRAGLGQLLTLTSRSRSKWRVLSL